MITALVLTLVLNGGETSFGYDYPNEMACNAAKAQVTFATTGRQGLELECVTTVPGGKVIAPSGEWQAIGVALHGGTTKFADRPMNVGVYPDGASCDALLKRATVKNQGMAGYDIVTICVPKAGK